MLVLRRFFPHRKMELSHVRQLHLFLRQASFLRCRFLIQILVGQLREAYDLIEIQRQGCGETGAVVLVGEVAVGGMAVFDIS